MEQEWEDVDEEFEEDEQDEYEQERIFGEQQDLRVDEEQGEDPAERLSLKRARREDETQEKGVVNSAYDMLHRLNLEWPCLSCDFIVGRDPSQQHQLAAIEKYPIELSCVAASQGGKVNHLYLLRCQDLRRTRYDDDSIDRDSDDSNARDDPTLKKEVLELRYGVNKIRCLNYSPIVALWNQNGEVMILNLMRRYDLLFEEKRVRAKEAPWKKVFKHKSEGWALDWNQKSTGLLVSGNTSGEVHLYNSKELVDWSLGSCYTYHKDSVQDIKFSPSQPYAFMSCSSDKTLQFIDTRVGKLNKSQLTILASDCDINSIDWNAKASHLVAAGDDKGVFKLFDLRRAGKSNLEEEIIEFSFHKGPITCLSFQPGEESGLAVASEDGRVSLWDLAAENEQAVEDYPNQLMFLHQGHQEVKDIRFHPRWSQLLMSTGQNGLHFFKPNLSQPQSEGDPGDIPQVMEEEDNQ